MSAPIVDLNIRAKGSVGLSFDEGPQQRPPANRLGRERGRHLFANSDVGVKLLLAVLVVNLDVTSGCRRTSGTDRLVWLRRGASVVIDVTAVFVCAAGLRAVSVRVVLEQGQSPRLLFIGSSAPGWVGLPHGGMP